MNILTKDFVEFIEYCVARDVRFLIVGGYALAAHGHPRATKDLDVWVMIDPNRRIQVSVGSVDAGFISEADLIANKKASARPQDLVDVQTLEARHHDEE
ncbi:MAG: hypothetical protein ACFCVK_04530 [Acidimicrobiales bacterium]